MPSRDSISRNREEVNWVPLSVVSVNVASHFVFPACENGNVDATQSQASWRTAWRKLTRLITCPRCGRSQDPGSVCRNEECRSDITRVHSPLQGLRFHDLRHHAITELAESRASDQTIMAIAGHVSQKMLAHYSHIRLDAKRRALDALSRVQAGRDRKVQPQGYVTMNGTNGTNSASAQTQVVEEYGRPVRARTRLLACHVS